jgi:ABC-type multidrug transport system fused ATPase/permease subunit
MRIMATFSEQGQKAYANAGAVATEVLSGIKTVLSFTAEQREIQRYRANLDDAERIGRKKGFLTGVGIVRLSFSYSQSILGCCDVHLL